MNELNGFLDQNSELEKLTHSSTRRVNTMNNWKKVLTFAFAMSIAVNLAAFDGGRSEEQEKKPTPATKIDSPKEMAATSVNSGEDYVVVMTSKDTPRNCELTTRFHSIR